MDKAQAVALVDAYGDAWVRQDPSAIVALFTDEARYIERPYSDNMIYKGRKGIGDYWIQQSRSAKPSVQARKQKDIVFDHLRDEMIFDPITGRCTRLQTAPASPSTSSTVDRAMAKWEATFYTRCPGQKAGQPTGQYQQVQFVQVAALTFKDGLIDQLEEYWHTRKDPPAIAGTGGEQAVAVHKGDQQNVELSEEDFEGWMRQSLLASPLASQGFEQLLNRAVDSICSIRRRLLHRGELPMWKRLNKRGRLLKELNEALPVAARVLEWVAEAEAAGAAEPITIVDVCSGVGYLSMLLCELLGDSELIARFVLVDGSFPQLNCEPKSHHINPSHLQLPGFWKKDLTHRRYDLKSSSGHRQLAQHVLGRAPGPVMLVGVHPCGMLSIRAVQLFHDHPVCTHLAIKPCCTPPIQLARQKTVWQLGGHTIHATDVCVAGKFRNGRWVGAPQTEQRDKFGCWCAHLEAAADGAEHSCATTVNWQLLTPCQGAMSELQAGGAQDGAATLDEALLVERPEIDDAAEGGQHSKRYQTVFIYATRPWTNATTKTGAVTRILMSSKDKTQLSAQDDHDITASVERITLEGIQHENQCG